MGKRLERRTYVLEFGAGTYLDGAEIRIRSTPIDVVEQLEELRYIDAIPLFLEYLEDWNLEDANGEPIKRTEEAVRAALELPVLKLIVSHWINAAVGVTAPLDPPSGDGPPLPDTDGMEQSIPMEPLSPSQSS